MGEKIYCQTCFGRIKTGAYVSENGKIFGSHNEGKCLEKAAEELENTLLPGEINIKLKYRNIKEIQEGIKNKEVVHYGKLERTSKEEYLKKIDSYLPLLKGIGIFPQRRTFWKYTEGDESYIKRLERILIENGRGILIEK